jgi:hypothetical protein
MKSATRKKLYTKNAKILKLLLNIVIIGTQALVIQGSKFLYACVKEICHLQAQPCFGTYNQLIIVDALCSQPALQVVKVKGGNPSKQDLLWLV